MTESRTRAYAEFRFMDGQYGIHLMIDGALAEPAPVVLDEKDLMATQEPWLILPGEAMHALYDAIGRALGKHTCSEEVLREALQVERQRTSKLLDRLVSQ